MAQELPEDGEVAIDNVGIRRGQCGMSVLCVYSSYTEGCCVTV